MTIIDERIYPLHQTAKEFLVRNEQEIHRENVHGYPKWKNSLRPQDSQRVLAEACKFCFSLRTIEMRFIDDGSIGEAPKTKKKRTGRHVCANARYRPPTEIQSSTISAKCEVSFLTFQYRSIFWKVGHVIKNSEFMLWPKAFHRPAEIKR